MSEYEQHIDEKFAPLSQDIHTLGDALGRAIKRHSGTTVFDIVEQLRLSCKQLRECAEALNFASETECFQLQDEIVRLDQKITHLVENCDLGTAIDVIRAFTVYFHLVNTAEQHHRTRRRRTYEVENKSADLHGSLAALCAFFQRNNLDAAVIQQLLNQLSIELVFTAHPTEATRRSMITKSRRLDVLLEARDQTTKMTSRQQANWQRALESTITLLWLTDLILHVRPEPLDEIKMGVYYLDEILYNAVPELYAQFEQLLSTYYPAARFSIPPFLRFGSWIGGDQDGNPNVTPGTLLQALRLQRSHVLERYRSSIEALAEEYSQSLKHCSITEELKDSIAYDARSMPDYDKELGAQTAQEPYRSKLSFMWKRLGATMSSTNRPGELVSTLVSGGNAMRGSEKQASPDYAYRRSEELLTDLELVRESLQIGGQCNVAQGELSTLMRQVQIFGFHFAALDVRQHSERHANALAELLSAADLLQENYKSLDEAKRVGILETLLGDPRVLPRERLELSEETTHVLATFDAIRQAREEFGNNAITCYIISMAHSLSDLLEVQFFCKEAGIVGLPIVPLFETIDDLHTCAGMLEGAFNHPIYRSQVEACHMQQQVMLGYSDSSKDGGILTSSWELYQAQIRLASLGQRHHIGVTIFHGRGGAVGRGGGPIYNAILGQPPNTVNGRIRITEQGEMLSFKYGLHEIALRSLELVVAGVVETSMPHELFPYPQILHEVPEDWSNLMNRLSTSAYTRYRDFIYNTPDFLRFFEQATPIQELGWLNIGSRPPRRSQGNSIEELRAIPWVFAWMQSRYVLPSWYGVGGAFEEYIAEQPARLEQLREMYRNWHFFKAFLDNLQMTLSKADMHIAQDYAMLVEDVELRYRLSGEIKQEYERTQRMVLSIVGGKTLLDNSPILQQSIRLRNPYVDPLSYFQVMLLRRLRSLGGPLLLDEAARQTAHEKERERDRLTYAVLLTINGIAAGLRNTG